MSVIDFRTGKPLERHEEAPPKTKPVKARPAQRKRGSENAEQRKGMLAKVHVAKKQLGLTDDEYRAMLEGNFCLSSAAYLSLTDLKRLVLIMAEYGFKPTKGSARRNAARRIDADGIRNGPGAASGKRKAIPATLQPETDDPLGRTPLMEKIEALLAEKGRVEGTHVPWAYAVAVLKKQSGGVTRCFEHATPEQLRGVISALTRDARRRNRRAY